MARIPRDYPETMVSAESGRPMARGEKLVTLKVDGRTFEYRQPGWWCSLDDPDDLDGQLVDEDNLVAQMARRSARAIARGDAFPPVLIRAIRLRCGLSQRDAGELFGTGEKSFEKYEGGQIPPSKPTQRLLRLAMERPDLFTKAACGEGKVRAPADIGLIQETIREARLDRIYAPLFETSLLSLQDQVVAELRPGLPDQQPPREPGLLRGSISMAADFDPLPKDMFDAMEHGVGGGR